MMLMLMLVCCSCSNYVVDTYAQNGVYNKKKNHRSSESIKYVLKHEIKIHQLHVDIFTSFSSCIVHMNDYRRCNIKFFIFSPFDVFLICFVVDMNGIWLDPLIFTTKA